MCSNLSRHCVIIKNTFEGFYNIELSNSKIVQSLTEHVDTTPIKFHGIPLDLKCVSEISSLPRRSSFVFPLITLFSIVIIITSAIGIIHEMSPIFTKVFKGIENPDYLLILQHPFKFILLLFVVLAFFSSGLLLKMFGEKLSFKDAALGSLFDMMVQFIERGESVKAISTAKRILMITNNKNQNVISFQLAQAFSYLILHQLDNSSEKNKYLHDMLLLCEAIIQTGFNSELIHFLKIYALQNSNLNIHNESNLQTMNLRNCKFFDKSPSVF